MPTPDMDTAPATAPMTSTVTTVPVTTVPVPEPAVHTVRWWVRWAGDFFRSPEGHAALLGFWGAVLITFGGLGAGAVRRSDPCWKRPTCPGCDSGTATRWPPSWCGWACCR